MGKRAWVKFIVDNCIAFRSGLKPIFQSREIDGGKLHAVQETVNGEIKYNIYHQVRDKITSSVYLQSDLEDAFRLATIRAYDPKTIKEHSKSTNKKVKKQKIVRKAVLTLEEVFPMVVHEVPVKFGHSSSRQHKKILDEYVNMASYRYQLFKEKGVTCVWCGIVGSFFALEKFATSKRYHLNLYALVGDREVLMTKDHIIPKSKGGAESLDNFQTMCHKCNSHKGCKMPSELEATT